jgi:ketosteroid isomerase-like protein
MSQENVALIEEAIAVWNSHDLDRWLACWDTDCEWIPKLRGEVEGRQIYRGHAGLRTYWTEDDAVWNEFLLDVHDLRAVGDQVVAVGTGTASGKSGVEVTTPFAMTFEVAERKIIRAESYLDVREALEALGLSE